MPGTNPNIDRQLGAFEATIDLLYANQERHAESTEEMRESLHKIEVHLAKIDTERRSAMWVNRVAMSVIAAIAGAFGGHVGGPWGTH